MFANRRDVRIGRDRQDPAGTVLYPRYFAWFNASTMQHFKAAGLPNPELARHLGAVGVPWNPLKQSIPRAQLLARRHYSPQD